MKSTGRLWLLAVCLLCGLVCTQAQEQEKKQLPREVPSPEKAARKMTDRMKEELQLTDKQYDKLYKLNLKEQQEHFATMTERGNGQRPLMGSRPGRAVVVHRWKVEWDPVWEAVVRQWELRVNVLQWKRTMWRRCKKLLPRRKRRSRKS